MVWKFYAGTVPLAEDAEDNLFNAHDWLSVNDDESWDESEDDEEDLWHE